MATPHAKTTTVLVLELDEERASLFRGILHSLAAVDDKQPAAPLAKYVVTDPEGIEDVLAITTGWTRNT